MAKKRSDANLRAEMKRFNNQSNGFHNEAKEGRIEVGKQNAENVEKNKQSIQFSRGIMDTIDQHNYTSYL